MDNGKTPTYFYVVKAEDLLALNYLPAEHPHPDRIEWINRATDRQLSPSTLEQLLRTYHRCDPSPSVVKLRHTSGVRAIFKTSQDRSTFARVFAEACKREKRDRAFTITAIYTSLKDAEKATTELLAAGLAQESISILWRTGQFVEKELDRVEGHSVSRVLAGVSGGGLAGAALGIAILVLPGVGPVAAAGAVLASAYSSVATASGIIGATGAAMATMLSDADVGKYAANHLEEQLQKGRVFVAVDTRTAGLCDGQLKRLLEQTGGAVV
ncbi:MAG: hypothetical protein P1U62_02960 [Alteraurantiacibacter sp. bin_em_oilr2.035]|nr:hypothetical protein [Alteraurantiacibacter sp. bin_em_oilr2.035]